MLYARFPLCLLQTAFYFFSDGKRRTKEGSQATCTRDLHTTCNVAPGHILLLLPLPASSKESGTLLCITCNINKRLGSKSHLCNFSAFVILEYILCIERCILNHHIMKSIGSRTKFYSTVLMVVFCIQLLKMAFQSIKNFQSENQISFSSYTEGNTLEQNVTLRWLKNNKAEKNAILCFDDMGLGPTKHSHAS